MQDFLVILAMLAAVNAHFLIDMFIWLQPHWPWLSFLHDKLDFGSGRDVHMINIILAVVDINQTIHVLDTNLVFVELC